MELICGLLLLIVGSATAGPYGYGTKGGAAAKADARAVAGAYGGAGGVPLSIPSGASYTGSFSQSSSSSSSSSSASSSSFSYSGSGAVAGVQPSGQSCESGTCNTGSAPGIKGASTAGAQAYGGATAGGLGAGYGGKVPVGSYGHKYGIGGSHTDKTSDCGSAGCQGANTNPVNNNSPGYSSQTDSDAKSSAATGVASPTGSACGSSGCENGFESDNCASGKCTHNKDCTSDDCVQSNDAKGSFSVDDINVQNTASQNARPKYSATGPDCSNGDCHTPVSGPTAYNKPAVDLTAPKLDSSCSGTNCDLPSSTYSTSHSQAPYLSINYQNGNQLGSVSSQKFPTSVKPSGQTNCAPGSLNCVSPGARPESYRPSQDHPPSVYTSSSSCIPGTPGCTLPSGAGCASGNCGAHSPLPDLSTTKPSYGATPSYSVPKPNGPMCIAGTPGCNIIPSEDNSCVSGNCGQRPPSYGSSSQAKPYFGSSQTNSVVSSSVPNCLPGSPGCSISTPSSSPSGCSSGNCGDYSPQSGYKSPPQTGLVYSGLPSSGVAYSNGSPLSGTCAPGSPGCNSASVIPVLTGQYNSVNSKPSYFQESNVDIKPFPQPCSPGTPGCNSASVISVLTGQYDSVNSKPSYSQGSNVGIKPIAQPCLPGTPGCSSFSSDSISCKSGNCDGTSTASDIRGPTSYKPNMPSLSSVVPSGTSCSPGSPNCKQPTLASGIQSSQPYGILSSQAQLKPSDSLCAPGSSGCLASTISLQDCRSGVCDGFPPIGGQSTTYENKPYIQGSSPSLNAKPSDLSCTPGTPGCPITPYYPTQCTSGKCTTFPAVQTCLPGSPGCSNAISGDSSPSNNGILSPGYGAGGYGAHSSGSYNVPSSSGPTTSLLGASSGTKSENDAKHKPVYTGGFGGPAGLLKPNEYNVAPATGNTNLPKSPNEPIPTSSCTSGKCDTHPSATHTHSGSASGVHAAAGASATANAVAYSGGFGGPPGFLKPYDDGKIDLKTLPGYEHSGSTATLNYGGNSGHAAYSNGAAVAQATAVSSASAGSGGDYGHGHHAAGGCGGGCGAGGYGGSHGSSDKFTAIGAAAKSIAAANSGARTFGSGYSSSSASAHASSSVKGGYGRR